MTDKQFAQYVAAIETAHADPATPVHLIARRGISACGDVTPGRQQTKVVALVTCPACTQVLNPA